MSFDLPTGIELEVVLPEGTTRLDLLDRLAQDHRLRKVPFPFPSKVPVPAISPDAGTPQEVAAMTTALMQDIARHHGAYLHSVAPDMRHFYLVHRAGRLVDGDGATRLTVVHDNTLAGGERVAELISPPLTAQTLGDFCALIDDVAGIAGTVIPATAAMHVHLDGSPFRDTRILARLARAYAHWEDALETSVHRTAELREAGPLPEGLVEGLQALAERNAPFADAAALLLTTLPSKSYGLNLRNLAALDAPQQTVELKIARSTLDTEEIRTVRALYLSLARWVLKGTDAPETHPPTVEGMRAALC